MKSYKQLIEGLLEAWPGTPEYEKKFGKAKGMSGSASGARHDIEKKDGVTRATRRYNDDGESEEPKHRETGGEPVKRGRGRPPGKYGSYKKKVKESLDIIESLETDEEIEAFLESLEEQDFLDLVEALNDEELVEEEQVEEMTRDEFMKGGKDPKDMTPEELAKHKAKKVEGPGSGAWRKMINKEIAGRKPKTNEEVESIEELSKSTLGSYVKKASHDAAVKGVEHGVKKAEADEVDRMTNRHMSMSDKDRIHAVMKTTPSDVYAPRTKASKRLMGVSKAVNRLTKEEAEVEENIKHPNQKVLDKNGNGKLDKEDFKILRGEKSKNEEAETNESSLVESFASFIKEQSKE